MSRIIQLLCFLLFFQTAAFSKDYILSSPDKKITIHISVGKNISWSVAKDQELLLKPSAMSMVLKDGRNPGIIPVVSKAVSKSVNQTIVSIIPVRNKLIPEVYNELKLQMKGNYAIEFRAYNDGVAYRFVTELGPQPIEVNYEEVAFNFQENCQIYLPKENNPELQSHYEGDFKPAKLQEVPAEQYGYLPLYVATPQGLKW